MKQIRGLQVQSTSPTAPFLGCYYYCYDLTVISLEGEHSGLSQVFGPRGNGKRRPVNLDSSISGQCPSQCCLGITERLDCEGSPNGCCATDLLRKMTPLIKDYHPAWTCRQGHTTHAKGLQTCCP